MPQIIFLIISIAWIYFSPKNNISAFLRFNVLATVEGVILGIVLAICGYGFYKWVKKTKKFYATVELFEDVLSPVFKNLKPVDMILLSLIAGFCEEVFFRGLLLPNLPFGLLLSSVAFGILHLPGFKFWIYSVWAALSGALFGWLFLLTGSLWLPITAHSVNNIIGMFLLTKVEKKNN